MARIVLVHGAMHGGWCWERLAPLLEAREHRVTALDLPGARGEIVPDEVTLDSLARTVADALDESDPALLVGHSLGGMAISAAAEARPEAIKRLVYLCALLPVDGETAQQVLELNEDRSVIELFRFAADFKSYELPPEARIPVLYHDCSSEHATQAVARLVPQSLALMLDRIALSPGRFGAVPKTYIEATEDAALHIAYQRRMVARYPGMDVRTLASAHSPFYSCPETLADRLDELAR